MRAAEHLAARVASTEHRQPLRSAAAVVAERRDLIRDVPYPDRFLSRDRGCHSFQPSSSSHCE